MSNLILTKDYFVRLDVTEKAKEIYASGLFSLYEVYNDGETESLIEDDVMFNSCLENGSTICIEIGFLPEAIIDLLPKNPTT